MLVSYLGALLYLLPYALGQHTQEKFEEWSLNVPSDFDFNAKRLIEFSSEEPTAWMTEAEKLEAKRQGKFFFDITDNPFIGIYKKEQYTYPEHPNATDAVHNALDLIQKDNLETTLAHFSSYTTRYYNSFTGKASSEWLADKVDEYVDVYAPESVKPLVKVTRLQHPWLQTSVIVRIAPAGAELTDPTTIVGAHCDSINTENPFYPAPGADDDGSGTVAVLEALRSILESGYIPVTPLEFHLYAAEEGGLLGSLAVVALYELGQRQVKGMIQFDTVAWVAAGTEETLNVMLGTDPALIEFQKKLIDKYIEIPCSESKYPMPWSLSDHASWAKAGYQACHSTEAQWEDMNQKNVHTTHDTLDVSSEFSFEHLYHYVRLAVAFGIELSSY
ncbi:Zn-dependent exopeptidase [Cylindrobasidium torrendii FP15055 ss-10]|uniref:Peptide hydrolase n=1 Tax=Cylindrobasidium torrendii FP15055 ss-10 TaxID=1314674 RepID=A0A0D7BQY5_9AGAR|nr:Zn-dependent exopeptidase [Cylindrobasidium torrendii FP15055 ss-10]